MTLTKSVINTIGTWVILANSVHLVFVYYIIRRITKPHTFTLSLTRCMFIKNSVTVLEKWTTLYLKLRF